MAFMRELSKVFSSSRAKMFAQQLDDIKWKFDVCEDAKVKQLAQDLMNSLSGAKNKRAQRKIAAHAEHLLDTVNTAQGKYSRLYAEYSPLGQSKFSKILTLFLPKKIQSLTKSAYYSAPRQVKQLANYDDFEDVAKMSSIKRYISLHPQDKQMNSYLWENYYLSTLEPEYAKFFKEIDTEYGVKLFTDKRFDGKPISLNYLKYLRDELENFKKASRGTAEFTPLLDITKFDIALNRFHAHGISVSHKIKQLRLGQGGTRIALDSPESLISSFRHESIHWFDTKIKNTKIGMRKAKISKAEKLEMENAGVTNTWYAETNDNEWKAVWGQGSMKRYSPEYKQKMINKGLPTWTTELDDVYMAKYLKCASDKNILKNIDEIEKAYDGKIPNHLAVELLDNPQNIKGINRLLKIKDRYGNKRFECFVTDHNIGKSLSPERLDALERIAKIHINGENPYEELMGVMLFDQNFSAKQVQKICAKLEKAAQKGETYDLCALFDRYFPFKDKIKMKQIATKTFGNVTNVTSKTFN